MYSCGPLHMDEQRQDDQLESTYNNSVLIQDVALKTYRKQWTIEKGGGRASRICMLMTRHDDDYIYALMNIYTYAYIYIYIYIYIHLHPSFDHNFSSSKFH